jgi:hypothetical protein
MHVKGNKSTALTALKAYAEKLIQSGYCGPGWGTVGTLACDCWELALPGQREVKLAQMDKEHKEKQKLAQKQEEEQEEEEEEEQEVEEKGCNSIYDFQQHEQVEEEQKDVVVVDDAGCSSDDFEGDVKRRRKRKEKQPRVYKIPKKIPKKITEIGGDHAEGVSDLLLPSCVSSILH